MDPRLLVVVCGMLLACSAIGQELIDTNFGEVDHAVKSERVTGSLPKGWEDNSSWAPVWIEYKVGEQEARRYLNMQVTRIDEGRAQLRHNLPQLDQEAYYRVELMARSPSRQQFQIGIREQGPPYDFVWSEQPTVGSGWEKLVWDFRLPAHASEVGLFINCGGVGELHLASLTLTRFTREQFMEQIAKKFPEGSPRNLMRTSTFPLGLQAGWNLTRELSDGDEVEMSAAPGLVPGGAALKIESTKPWQIHSAPFEIARPMEKHTASIFGKGSGKLTVTVFSDAKQLGTKSIDLRADEWTRCEVTFEPVLLAKANVLQFSGDGSALLDGVQVNAGEVASDRAMWMDQEVALAATSPTRVTFADEPAVVRYQVVGTAAGSRVKARIVSVYGDEKEVPADAITRDSGAIQFDVFQRKELGAFRVEAWTEDESGKALSPVNELVVLRVNRPRYWGKDAPNSPFGVHTLSANRHSLMAKSVGVNWVRLHDAGTGYIGWRYLEPEKGKWEFKDQELGRYRTNNLKILGAFATSPNWASYFKEPHNGYFDQFYLPRDWNDYANYVKVTAEHHKGVIDTYDIWNEPWIFAWWGVAYDKSKAANNWDQAGYVTSENPQADFAHMTKLAAETAKSVDPSIRILGVNSTTSTGFGNSVTGQEWTKGIVAAGGETPADVYCYHQYTDQANLYPGDSVEKGFEWAMGPIKAKYGKLPKPVWMTEGSALRAKLGAGLYKHTVPAKDDLGETADGLVRYVVSLLANGVEKVFLYSMHGHDFFGKGGDWKVLVMDDGFLHPSATAHANMAWLLEDSKFVERVEVAANVNAYLFEGSGRATAVISPVPGTSGSYAVPAGAKAVDLFGNSLSAGAKVENHVAYVTGASVAEVRRVLGK